MQPKNTIWYVDTDEGTLTVIAATADDARVHAADYLDTGPADESISRTYASTDWPPEHWRAVGFDSPSDRDNQIRDLEAAGVDLARVRRRDSETALGGAPWWEVVARDIDWCRLPAGVLCEGGS